MSIPMVLAMTACSATDISTQATSIISSFSNSEEEDLQADEDATTGVDVNSLESDELYVLHNGVYYPAWSAYANYDQSEEPDDFVPQDPSKRQLYYSTEDETNIPTLYLNKGDKLIYCKDTDTIDYITFERYQDLGYTIPLYNIHSTTGNARYYIDLTEDEGCILPGSSLEQITTDVIEGNNVTLSNLGRLDITEDIVRSTIHYDGVDSNGNEYDDVDISSKLIEGCVKNETYDLEVYDGTNYLHYLATCNMHAFEQFEIFRSVDFTALKSNTWEVDIPDYLVTGYYKLYVNSVGSASYTGLVRIVVGTDTFDIDDADSFNNPLLILNNDNLDSGKGCYSETDELNTWSSDSAAENSLGYVTDDTELEAETVAANKSMLIEASVQKYNLTFMQDLDCQIQIIPSETDSAGDIYVLYGDEIKQLTYDRIYNTYTLDLTGDGNCYTLIVSGLWHTYDINLTNVKSTPDAESLSVLPSTLTDVLTLDEYEAGQTETEEATVEATNEFGETLKNSKLSSDSTTIISLEEYDENSSVYMIATYEDESTEIIDFTSEGDGVFSYTFNDNFDENATYELRTPTENYSIDYQ